MVTINLSYLIILFLLGIGLSAAISGYLSRRYINQIDCPDSPLDEDMCFLFDGDELIDATPTGTAYYAAAEPRETERLTLIAALKTRFSSIDAVSISQGTEKKRVITATRPDDGAHVEVSTWNGFIRYNFVLTDDAALKENWELEYLNSEFATLRSLLNTAPMPIWRQTPDGTITWANQTYLDLTEQQKDEDTAGAQKWPPKRLFPDVSLNQGAPEGLASRQSLSFPGGKPTQWFDCKSFAQHAESFHYAINTTSVVEAEKNLQDFVQTLGKTFAHLPIGLAIFDRDRRLSLFNPAMIDLTDLPVEFLSARPSLPAVFDRLRETRILPEPRSYSEWRGRLTRAESESASNHYEETWSLPSGRTYRLTGRPHPNNGVAFLLEDISSEVSLTRHFREEVELSQSVLDTCSDAVAVFSSGGRMTLTNKAFIDLWHSGDDYPLQDCSVIDATRLWRTQSHPTPAWGDLREFVTAGHERSEWTADVRLLDGRGLRCSFSPLSGNATLARFTLDGQAPEFSTVRHHATQQ
ncbi:MAG: PAS domain-containing protein [Pseudoruegeria sp.]